MDNVTRIRTASVQTVQTRKSDTTLQPPCSIEAEQALLGAILSNNDIYQTVSQVVDASHFFDPVHRGLFELIGERIRRNSFVTPVSLQAFIASNMGISDLGGFEYLVKLADSAVSIHASTEYAEQIRDLAVRRQLIDLGMDLAERARCVEYDRTAFDEIADTEQKLYQLGATGTGDNGFQSFVKSMTGAVEIAASAAKRKSGIAGLSTGLVDLDNKLGGLHRSDLVIIAGRPSMGKTALATNIGYNVAKKFNRQSMGKNASSSDGGIIGFFSLEMSSVQLAQRILAESSKIPASRIRSSQIDEGDYADYVNAARKLQSLPVFIDDTPALTIAQIALRARRLKQTKGLHLLIVDYLQLVRSSGRNDNRVNEISEVTRGLKEIAKELDVPVIAVSQLSRQVENRDEKRPLLSDLRESGSIEQDADVVLFVYREEYYLERKKPDDDDAAKIEKWQARMNSVIGQAEVIVAKQRQGPVGTVSLTFEGKYTLFGNKPEDGREDPGYSPAAFAQ